MSKAGRRALVGAIAAVTFVAALLAVAQDQETLQVRSAVSASDAESPAYIAALVGSSVSRSNSYDVLRNGDEIFPAMLDAINSATRRISFETYIYEKGMSLISSPQRSNRPRDAAFASTSSSTRSVRAPWRPPTSSG